MAQILIAFGCILDAAINAERERPLKGSLHSSFTQQLWLALCTLWAGDPQNPSQAMLQLPVEQWLITQDRWMLCISHTPIKVRGFQETSVIFRVECMIPFLTSYS